MKPGRFIALLITVVVSLSSYMSGNVIAHQQVVVVPLGGTVGDAIAEDVVAGKTFSSQAAGKGVAGTLVLPPSVQTYTNVYGMTFNLLPAGTFTMGTLFGTEYEQPVHQVTLTQSFYMQTTEITQEQWRIVVSAAETAGYLDFHVLNEEQSCSHAGEYKPTYPVECVSWDDIYHSGLEHLTSLRAKSTPCPPKHNGSMQPVLQRQLTGLIYTPMTPRPLERKWSMALTPT